MLSKEEIEKISDLIFKKLVKHYDKLAEQENKQIEIEYKEIAENVLSEQDMLYLQLERLVFLEKRFVNREEYLKATVILNKINKIKNRLNKLS